MALPTLMGEFTAGKDGDLRMTHGGRMVCGFSIIANSAKQDENGEWVTTASTPWINVNAWGSLGERAGEEVVRGCKVFVVGRLKVRKYLGNDGTERESLELDADAIQVIPRREPAGQSRRSAAADPWADTPGSDEAPF